MTGPEVLMHNYGPFWKLFKKSHKAEETAFLKRLLYVVIDKAHLITGWLSFWNSYLQLDNLQSFIPKHIPYLLPSATLCPPNIKAIMTILWM
jgi:superfamily II DNA helicase RecQ